MNFNQIKFVLKESLLGIVKNIKKSFIQFIVCYMSLVLFTIVLGGYYNIQSLATNMEDEITLSIFIKDSATKEEIDTLELLIRNNTNINNYEFTSKEEAKIKGESMFSNSPEMIEAISDLDNPFPASFTIELTDKTLLEEVAAMFDGQSAIEENGVKYGEEYADKIIALSSGLRFLSYLCLAFFFSISIFFIISIVNVIVAGKEEENTIMFIIGASPIQIKTPFYIQGLIFGLASSGLAYYTFSKIYNTLVENLPYLLISLSNVSTKIHLVVLITGAVSGLVATTIALKSFSKKSKRLEKNTK